MDGRNNSTENFKYCSKCGKKNSAYDKFCTHCGNKLTSIEDSVKNTVNEVKEGITGSKTYQEFTKSDYEDEYKADFNNKDMVNFIQKKVEYYIPTFKEIEDDNKSTSWNWAAFFFNSWWLLYRKMYAYGFGIIAGTFILTSIMPMSSFVVNIIVAVLCGLYGNILYLKQTVNQLRSVATMDSELKQRILLSRGGVNIVIPIILGIITLLALLLVGAVGTFFYMLSSPYYY
ncbi:MAG: DUF2628 domain-containing protein [Terrisporobacter sp.]|uniref:DUF2628 domain-containing protein n=1 Tax=Terrisporobacter sp. TaxID=1965305 RepID=UPI002FC6606F